MNTSYKIRKSIHNLFGWKVPSALPMRFHAEPEDYTWEDWAEEMKVKYPYKFLLFETIPRYIDKKIYSLGERWYKIRSLYWTKQHLLDLRNYEYEYGYCDAEWKILYACFNTLEQYMKDREIEWYKDKNLELYQALLKAKELCDWWQNEYHKDNHPNRDDYEDKERWAHDCINYDEQREQEVTNKLKELMDIRKYLWD